QNRSYGPSPSGLTTPDPIRDPARAAGRRSRQLPGRVAGPSGNGVPLGMWSGQLAGRGTCRPHAPTRFRGPLRRDTMNEDSGIWELPDGAWHAWVGCLGFDGTREECLAWIEGRRVLSDAEPFLRAIAERPGDALARLVFADWLEDRGRVLEASGERWLAE